MGSILSGLFGGGSSPGQDAQMQGLHAARADIQRYRPEAMQAALNAMSNASSGYQGANNALQTLWGAPAPAGGPAMSQLNSGGFSPNGPQKVLGHEMPRQPQMGSDPRYVEQDPVGNFLDPAGIFNGLKGL